MNKALINSLAQELEIPTIKRGDKTLLIRSTDMEKLLDLCLLKNIAVVGIEGFYHVGEDIIPDMDMIADFSSLDELPWLERCSISVDSSRLFLKTVEHVPNLVFDIDLSMNA